MKGSERNIPCPCGSGKKAKRCHPQMVPPEGYVEGGQKESPWAIISAFSEELAEINRVLAQHGPTDFVARLYLRSLFSILDGYAWYVKHRAREGAKRAGVELTKDDLEIIYELREKDARDGTKRLVPKILPTGENLLYAIRLYARVRKSEPPLVDDALPPEFKVAADARNRITHPKSTLEFKVFPQERAAAGKLLLWLQSVMNWVRDEELKNIEEIKEEVNASFEEARRKILGTVRSPPE